MDGEEVAQDADATFGGLALGGEGGGRAGALGDVGEQFELQGAFEGLGDLIEEEIAEEAVGVGHEGSILNAREFMVKRSRVDWVLEGVALAAVLGAVLLVAIYWPLIPARFGRPAGIMSARNVLWMVAGIDVLAYAGLTWGARGGGLFEIPAELERQAPHLRQMLYSMVIVMKAVLALFAMYLVWALVNVGLRRGGGLSGAFLTLFTLAVPVPLVFYTVKMRRYKK